MASNLQKLKSILSKPPAFRNTEDLREIGGFISNIKFFYDLNDSFQFNECCNYITYEFYKENHTLFKFGDVGDKFYILMKGEASVLIPIKSDEKVTMKEVLVYKDGSSFGELALTDGRPRAATILTRTECHFAVLDKVNYKRILASTVKKKMSELVEFLRGQALFSKLTKGSLVKLSYCFEEKVLKKEQILFSEGENIENLYLIKEGEVTLSKKVQISFVDFECSNKYKNQLNKRFSHKAGISISGKGEFLGLYDIDQGKFSTTACVLSATCLILRISLSDFKKRINNTESFNIIDERKKLRNFIHDESMSSVKKIIKERVSSSSHRRIMLSVQKINQSHTPSPIITEIELNQPLFQSNSPLVNENIQESPKIIRKKFKIPEIQTLLNYDTGGTYTSPTINHEFRLKNEKNSMKSIKLKKISYKLLKNSKIENKTLNNLLVHYEGPLKTVSPKMISLLKPFGRSKLEKIEKKSDISNIHTFSKHLKDSIRVPSHFSFRRLKGSSIKKN